MQELFFYASAFSPFMAAIITSALALLKDHRNDAR